jgi:5-hydroxyisourate hydrolase-like protein (transthyretin family)
MMPLQTRSRLTALGVIAAAAIFLHGNPHAQEMRVSTSMAPPQAVNQQPMGPVQFNGTAIIVGQVIDAGSGRGVAGAIVTLGSSAPPGPQRVTTEVRQTMIAGGAGPMVISEGGSGAGLPRVLTDSEGRFAFRNLPKGAFGLTATKAGYLDGSYGRLRPSGSTQTLDIADGERQGDVKIRLFRPASISGIIIDDTGEPVVGAPVRAYRRTLVSGRKVLSATGTGATTDDRGMYRLSALTPGEFIVGVPSVQSSVPAAFQMAGGMAGDLMSTIMTPGNNSFSLSTGGMQVTSDGRFLLQPANRGAGALPPDAAGRVMVYPTQYYPSATTVSQASAIVVTSGEDRTGVDMQLKLVPTATISGHLTGPEGAAANWAVHLVPSDTGDLSADPDVATTITDQNGEFAFLGVPAGQYVIQTVRPGRNPGVPQVIQGGGGVLVFSMTVGAPIAGAAAPAPQAAIVPTLWAAQPIAVAGTDINGIAVTLRQGQRVLGKIEFDGSAERPPADRLSQVLITVESADGKQRAAVPPTRVEATSQFTLTGLLPGKYVLRASNVPGGWTYKGAMHGGVDLSDSPFEVSDKDITGVVITFADRVTELRGTVKAPDNSLDSSAAVIVFPSDNRSWAQYGVNPRRMRITRSSKTGVYTFNGLPAGDYYIAAISDEYASEWQDPQFLEALTRSATRLTLGDGEKKMQDLARSNARPGGPAELPAPHDGFGTTALVDSPELPDRHAHGPFVDDAGQAQQTQPPPRTRDPRAPAPPPPAPGQARDAVAATPKPGTAVAAGRVTLEDGQPVRRARVTLRHTETRFERAAATDENGRFSIAALPAGRYTVMATKGAYLTTYFGSKRAGRGPGTSLALVNGQTVNDLALTLTKGAVIAGTLRDDQGQPVVNAIIQVMQFQTTNGVRSLVQVPSGGANQTDDRGAYRLFGLLPGAYVVTAQVPPTLRAGELRQLSTQEIQSAVADLARPAPAVTPAPAGGAGANASAPPMGRTVGYAQVYYPGTLDQAGAATVNVTAGQELLGIDFAMRLVATAKVEGVVMGVDGRPAAGVQISLQQSNPTANQIFVSGGVRTNAEGKFTATNVAPGRYTLTARASAGGRGGGGAGDFIMFRAVGGGDGPPPPPPPPMPMMAGGSTSTLWAMVDLDVNGEDVGNVALTLQEGMTVSGRVAFAGKSLAPPTDLSRMNIMLFPAGTAGGAVSIQTGRVDENGTFQIAGVMPGRYRVQTGLPGAAPGQSGPSWSVRSAIADGRDTLDVPLEIKPGQNVEGMVVTFSDQATELTGSLIDQAGKPAPGFTILVFSTDRAHWSQGSRRLAQPTQPGSDGKFRIANLPPGEYFMAAVTDLEPGDWGDATFMEAVAAAAFKITLGEGEKKVQDVKIAG